MHRLGLAFLSLVLVAAAAQAQTADRPPPRKLPPEMARWLKSTPEQILQHDDRDGDGYLSRDEVPPFMRLAFDRADLNKDGKLDRQEIAAFLQKLRQRVNQAAKLPAPDSPAVQEVLQRLLRLDADGDGKISRAEARGPLAENFDRLDANKDGYLDRAELLRFAQRAAAARAGGAGAAAQTLDFDALDRNADGRLTRDELRGTPLEPLFDQIDTNHDGRIDPREFEAFLKKRQAGK